MSFDKKPNPISGGILDFLKKSLSFLENLCGVAHHVGRSAIHFSNALCPKSALYLEEKIPMNSLLKFKNKNIPTHISMRMIFP